MNIVSEHENFNIVYAEDLERGMSIFKVEEDIIEVLDYLNASSLQWVLIDSDVFMSEDGTEACFRIWDWDIEESVPVQIGLRELFAVQK